MRRYLHYDRRRCNSAGWLGSAALEGHMEGKGLAEMRRFSDLNNNESWVHWWSFGAILGERRCVNWIISPGVVALALQPLTVGRTLDTPKCRHAETTKELWLSQHDLLF